CDRLTGIVACGRLCFLHLVGSLIELPAQLRHLCVATLARETFQLTRRFARLVDQLLLLSLIAARPVCRSLLHAPALFFERLLLATRELFEPSFSLTLLSLSLLLLRALHRLILVLHLVELELEQTSQLLLLSFTTAAAAVTLIPESDLHLAEDRVGREQSLQCALLWWQRVFA